MWSACRFRAQDDDCVSASPPPETAYNYLRAMPDRPLTILQLTHQGGPAGSTQSIFGLSQHLARRGHRVVVGCREDTLLARLAREAALPVAPLAFTGIGALARGLAGVIARERVDVVSAHATRDRRALAWLRWRGALPLALVGLEADERLRALAAAVPARHRVVFVPPTDRPLAFYHLAAAAALPSRIEGMSQTLLEAMALGLPVVASDYGGNPDLVRSGETGLLVPPLDPAAWARALARLLGDAGLARRLARAGREPVRREFTPEGTAARTEAIYREALARRYH